MSYNLRAEAYFKQNNIDQAVVDLQNVLSIDGENVVANRLLKKYYELANLIPDIKYKIPHPKKLRWGNF